MESKSSSIAGDKLIPMLTLFECSIIVKSLSAFEKLEVLSKLSSNWRSFIFSGYAWRTLYQIEDPTWRKDVILLDYYEFLSSFTDLRLLRSVIFPELVQTEWKPFFLENFENIQQITLLSHDEDCMNFLGSFSDLRSVVMKSTPVSTNSIVDFLKSKPKLASLELKLTQSNEKFQKFLQSLQFRNIEQFRLPQLSLPCELSLIYSWKSIEHLQLMLADSDPLSIQDLSPSLISLKIKNVKLKDVEFSKLERLETLSLIKFSNISSKFVVLRQLKSVKSLHLEAQEQQVTLGQLPNLKELSLQSTSQVVFMMTLSRGLSHDINIQLAQQSIQFINIEELFETSTITKIKVGEKVSQYIEQDQSQFISEEGILLNLNLSHLKSLDLVLNQAFYLNLIPLFQQQLPMLEVLSINYKQGSSSSYRSLHLTDNENYFKLRLTLPQIKEFNFQFSTHSVYLSDIVISDEAVSLKRLSISGISYSLRIQKQLQYCQIKCLSANTFFKIYSPFTAQFIKMLKIDAELNSLSSLKVAQRALLINPCKWYLDNDISRLFKQNKPLESLILPTLKVLKFKFQQYSQTSTFKKILQNQLVFVPNLEEFSMTFEISGDIKIEDPFVVDHMRLKKIQLVNLGKHKIQFGNFKVNRRLSPKLVWIELIQITIHKCQDCMDLVSQIKSSIEYWSKGIKITKERKNKASGEIEEAKN